MEKLISIGYTKKPHGLKGEIKLHIEDRYLEDLLEAGFVVGGHGLGAKRNT